MKNIFYTTPVYEQSEVALLSNASEFRKHLYNKNINVLRNFGEYELRPLFMYK